MDLVKVGKLLKPFGVDGHMKYDVKDQHEEDFKKAEVIFINQSDGDIPYFVEEVKLGNPPTVLFEEISSKELASKLSHSDIYLRTTDITLSGAEADRDSDLLSMAGFNIKNGDHTIGVIEEVVEYPQQLMAIVKGADYQVLVPLVEHYIENIDVDSRTIICSLPDGLVESQL